MLQILYGGISSRSGVVSERQITYVALLQRTCSALVCGRSLALGLLVRQIEAVADEMVQAEDWFEVQ